MNLEPSPWICHVCDKRAIGASTVCSVCYRTTCRAHLQGVTAYNRQNGLYEINWRCLFCATGKE